jgi:hypothetical protein
VWYTITVGSAGTLIVNTFGSSYDTILSIYTGTPGSFTGVGCNDDSGGLQSRLMLSVVAGQRFVIMVSSFSAGGGVLGLNAFVANAAPPTFTDDPLTAGTTTVKAVHVTELRQAIAALRARYALGVFTWMDASPVAGVTQAKAVHLTELRTALNAAYTAAGRVAPTYTHAIITGGTTVITAVDIAELRAAVLGIW